MHNADYCAIRNCITHHCRRGIFIYEALRSEISGCEAWACADRFNREQGNIGIMSYVAECLLENNVVHDTRQHGIRFYGGHYGNVMRGNIAWNCHIGVHIKGAFSDREQTERLLRFADGGAPNIKPDLPVLFERNVAHQVDGTGLIPSASVFAHNTGAASQSGSATERRLNLEYAPEDEEAMGFVAPQWHDLRLQSNSPHVGAGVGGETPGAFPYRDEVFFVGPDGDDDNAGTSVAQAWGTLQAAAERLQAGQTLYLLPGEYTETLSLQGLQAEEAPTLIRAREKGSVTLRAGGKIALNISDCTGVKVEGLRLTGATSAGAAIAGSAEVTIAECEVFANAAAGVQVDGSRDVRVMQSTIVGNGVGVRASGETPALWIVGNIIRGGEPCIELSSGLPEDGWFDHNNIGDGTVAAVAEQAIADLAQWQAMGFGARSVDLAPGLADPNADDFRLTRTSLCRGRGYLDRHMGAGREVPNGHNTLEIADVRVAGTTATTADLQWRTTGSPATMIVAWGTDPANLDNLLVRDTGHYYRTEHLATLTELQPATTYHFRVGYRRMLEGPSPYHDFRYAWPERGPQGEAEYYDSVPKQDTWEDETHSFTTGQAGELPAAREFHVSGTGDDAAEGSPEAPLATITRACELAGPGDRVIIHEGSWHETIRPLRSGLPEAPIAFEAAPGEHVVIDGRRELIPHGADLRERKHITLRGLFFFGQSEYAPDNGSGGQVYLVHSEGITMERCVFDGRMNYVAAILSAWSKDITVHNNIFVNHHGSIVSHDSLGTLTITRNTFLGPTIYKLYAPRSRDIVCRGNLLAENLFPKKKEQYKLKLTSYGEFDEDYNCYVFDPANDIRAAIDWTPPGADLTRITALPEQQVDGVVTRYGVRGDLALWHKLGRGLNSFIVEGDPGWANPELIERLRGRTRGWPNRFFDYPQFSREDLRLLPDSPCLGAGEGGSDIGADYAW